MIRVCREISKFPSHASTILTSAVIACMRSGFHKSGMELAMTVMKPEYRKEIPSEFKRKIENHVRKGDKLAEDPVVHEVPCMHCGAKDDEMNLCCATCDSDLDFCIATGWI